MPKVVPTRRFIRWLGSLSIVAIIAVSAGLAWTHARAKSDLLAQSKLAYASGDWPRAADRRGPG